MKWSIILLCLQQVIVAQVNFSNKTNGKNSVKDELNLFLFPNVRDFSLNANQDELYFTAQSPQAEISVILFSKKKNGIWAKPVPVKFSGKWNDLEPFLSPDGLRLYFASNRPLVDSGKTVKDYDVWFVERKTLQSPWGSALNCGNPINSSENEFYPCITRSSNLYFTNDGKKSKGKDDIFVCYFKNGKYEAPVSVSDSINTEGYEFNAFVSLEEKFMLFTGYNKPDGLGSGDLYISYRDMKGNWSKPINLGITVNSKQMDYCPFVDEKTKTLYFTSKRYDSKVKEYKGIDEYELMELLNDYENGQSRLYKMYIGNRIN